jgi:hypothetical protein
LVYLACVLIYCSKFGFNLSSTVEFSYKEIPNYNGQLPKGLLIEKNAGFDGQFFYLTAIDPFHQHVKIAADRYQRIIYPLLAWIFSFGNTGLIPLMLLIINYFSIIAGAYILMKLLKEYNAPPELAYLWAFNVGFLISVVRNLGEPLMFLLAISAVYCIKKEKNWPAVLFLTLAVLTKEAALFIALPIIIYFIFRKDVKKILLYGIPLLVFIIWQIIIFFQFKEVAIFMSSTRMGIPLVGIIKYLLHINIFQLSKYNIYYLTALPAIIFALTTAYLFFKGKKNRSFSLYEIILLFQVFFILSLSATIYTEFIDAVGRYAMALFLFYIIYVAENNKKYNIILMLLSVLMFAGYFLAKIIMFKAGYFVIQ